MSECAGREKWVWEGNELIDPDGVLIARVTTDVIDCADQRILMEATPGILGFKARGTSSTGAIYTAGQRGLTVSTLQACCDGRNYCLQRVSPWRKERVIHSIAADGSRLPVAHVRPLISGRVEIVDAPGNLDVPLVDSVFLSWVCVLVDTPVRRPVA